MSIRSILKFIIGWPIALISLFFILKTINPNLGLIGSYLTNANLPVLFLGLVCFLIYFFLRAYSWQLILKAKKFNIPFKDVLYFWELSEFKRYIPGNIISFVSRGVSFTEKGVPKNEIIHSLIVEVELIILSCLIVSLFSMQFLINPLPIGYKNLIYILIFIFIILISAAFIFSAWIKLKTKNRFISYLCCNFTSGNAFNILAYSVTSFLFFGLGSFFIGYAFFYLDLTKIFVLSGFFTFSLLIGYLSFITPMGLGIREGVITFGLSILVSASIAGLVAVFSRVFLILSEIIFILLTFLIYKVKSAKIEKFYNIISKFKHETILVILFISYNAYFISASILRYEKYFTGRFDLGNMDQVVWNTLHGRWFELTDPNGVNIISRLAFHADYILVLLAPFYLIWSDARMLLIIQTIVLSFGAIFVYLLAKNVLKNKTFSLILAASFLIYPAINYTNLYDFHPVTLGTTFLLGVFYFLYKKRYFWFTIFLILAGITKEQVWLTVSLIGIYLILINFKKKKNYFLILFGLLISIVSVLIFYYLISIAIPAIRGSNHFALAYFSEFGDSPLGIIKNMLFSPLKTFSLVFHESQILYLAQLLLPLGFLSFLAPLFLIFATPDLGINLLSNNAQLHQIYYQYSATISPFVFISAIYGIRFFREKFSKINSKIIYVFIIFFSIWGAYLYGPLPGASHPNLDMFTKRLENKKNIDKFLSNIPQQYSIAATNNVGSHLSHRQKLFTIPVGIDRAEMIVFLLNDQYAQPSLATQIEMAKKLEKDKNYIQIFKDGDFVVFEKKNLFISVPPKKTPNKLFPYAIEVLGNRKYNASEINIENNINLRRILISYKSDGLKIYATMSIPSTSQISNEKFPVLILNHGYINPAIYNNITDYSQIEEYFASQGFLVIKPDYRGNGKSDGLGEPLNRFAYPIDVLNLIASLENIPQANTNKIYIWGHSMGGEVSLEVAEVASKISDINGKIKAIALWAPVTDPVKWFNKSHLSQLPEAIITPFPYQQTFQIMGTPSTNSKIWESVSPLKYLKDINIPIILQHGTADVTVPYQWSTELYENLKNLNKKSKLILYPDNDHNLSLSHAQALTDSINFFKSY
jgi:uncharacterized membrane protein/pimeloyl-ACP methyl ester carboxylesterase/uncharacterized membrane protein YbhN (UPF0104 family)